ncbi:MAG: flagellar biosynthesis protein FlhA [Spirochaetales bacterium]|nr:flagellar biosynthesis protein FlhA [Spirochaetales bacterium]
MADAGRMPGRTLLANRTDILVAIGVIVFVMMLIIPLPAVILDTLMAANLMLSLLIILIVLFTGKALEFTVFPTMLLVSTVFGLALNVSSTRLILKQGSEFSGKIVRAFATFVVGSEGSEGIVIGFVIFLILIAVQFIVITKGSTRVAEVAARFTLDSLPGKQMAIEASYNSGAITEEEAARQKSELQKEADFYGAMDGASKFVSGNVKVGLLITAVNLIAGIIVGVTIHHETINVALSTYFSLTVGDGLVSQLPALLISTATGLIVTRAISDGTFGSDVRTQFSTQARIYWIAAGFLFVLAFLPGFPWYVLIPMSLLIGFVAFRLTRKENIKREQADREEAASSAQRAPAEIAPVVPLDPLSLELGYGLIPLVDKDQGAELLDRITRIRRESALELGLVVPRIRIIDNMRLEPAEYCIKIKGVETGKGSIRIGHYLAINPGSASEDIPGDETKDPAFGLPALWITDEYRDRAERAGYTVVDSPSIIATHLTEVIKKHAWELLGRQEVQAILDTLRNDYSAVVDELNKSINLGEIQKVLQMLLQERVSVRNMITIMESLADYAPISKDPGFLAEKARQALGREICLQYADQDRVMHVMTLHPDIEQTIIDSRVETAGGVVAALEPAFQRKWINSLANAVKNVQDMGHYPVLLCQEASRALVKNSTVRDIPDIAVLSVPEISRDIKIESLGQIVIEE